MVYIPEDCWESSVSQKDFPMWLLYGWSQHTTSIRVLSQKLSNVSHLISDEALDEWVSLFQPAVHDEGDAHSQTPEDLLVL